ncbi:ADP-ribosylglycohydrolase family protein, partial [Streptomyces anulatus]|uniref:ADP-ribosylglycohydrolase family protein n=1 Tax=Streptomyces anulatus TaxID=1892 RepID=UPI003664CD15
YAAAPRPSSCGCDDLRAVPPALWALRTTETFERALAAAVDVGGDTDTVAAVTGGLAEAVHGIGAVPARWTEPLHVPLPGYGDRRLTTGDLLTLAGRLDSEGPRSA